MRRLFAARTGKEVEDGHVHQVDKPPSLVVRRRLRHAVAVRLVRLPARVPVLAVRPTPRVAPRLARHVEVRRQVGGHRALDHVRRAAHRVPRVAVVAALAVEARVAGCEKRREAT